VDLNATLAPEAQSEEWRPVLGYERYDVSSRGQVRLGAKIISQRVICGYAKVTLNKAKVAGAAYGRKDLAVSILVCTAFHGPKPTPAHQAAHGNGERLDNRAENLRWATAAENCADRIRHGTHPGGENNPRAVLSVADVIEVRRRAQHERYAIIADDYGVTRQNIYRIANRKTWKHV
jgi:hypothetical protein